MIEHRIWAEAPKDFVVGADEVGRGSIAGPIVAASVSLNSDHLPLLEGVKDSKKISESKRELIFERIIKTDIEIHYSSLSNKVIDDKGITFCNKNVIRDVILPHIGLCDNIFIDYVSDIDDKARALTKGEDASFAIALASILAKVHRDRIMIKLSKTYPQYDLDKNKGYGTKSHYEAIKKYGTQDIHRMTFLKLR
tara:strand:- start:23 stop:607 length:585 start_codon:yes stop_codon:yes gene_type:complete